VASANKPDAVADKLHSASIHLLRSVAREVPTSGLGPARLSALSVIVFRGPLTLGELAEVEQVKPPTMTKIVHALHAAGLIRKETLPGDRRSVRVSATADGKRLLKGARRRRLRVLAKRLKGLSERDLATLDRAAALMEEAASAAS
jgi:DNA-binding MarR family transcriptional regulator